jgi:dTDP-4-amino-4,6-dideoxygalactose transaminase
LTTRNAAYDAKFRLWRQHSMSVPDTVRHASNTVVFEEYPEVGFNYRMTDIQAAVGREQLKKLPEMVARRRELARRYFDLLRGIDGLALPDEPAGARSNFQSFCVRLPERCDQVRFMQSLLDDGISARRGIMCAHRERAYPAGSWRHAGTLRESERAQDRAVILPLFHQMTDEDQQRVASAVKSALTS